jgi:hypothetical protein
MPKALPGQSISAATPFSSLADRHSSPVFLRLKKLKPPPDLSSRGFAELTCLLIWRSSGQSSNSFNAHSRTRRPLRCLSSLDAYSRTLSELDRLPAVACEGGLDVERFPFNLHPLNASSFSQPSRHSSHPSRHFPCPLMPRLPEQLRFNNDYDRWCHHQRSPATS